MALLLHPLYKHTTRTSSIYSLRRVANAGNASFVINLLHVKIKPFALFFYKILLLYFPIDTGPQFFYKLNFHSVKWQLI